MKRNSNIELIRIISMFMIVISHYCVHNDIVKSSLPLGINRYLLEIGVLGNIGVILFVLITGYFSINSKEPFKLRKLFIFWFETFIYSFLIYIIIVLIGKEHFAIKTFIKSLLPITFRRYWFMSAFILLYIFIPYINKAINSLGRKEHLKLICISLFIFYILRMLSGQHFYGNELVQLMVIYTIGAFFGKYKGDILSNKKLNIVVFIITSILLLGGTIVFDLLKSEYLDPVYLYDRASIFALLFSVSLFNIFACKKEFTSKFINTVSSCVLGVYLISEQPNLRKLLWKKWFVVSNYVDKPYMILYMIGIVLAIFIVCIIIDYIRKNTIERFGLFVYDKIDKYWEKRHEKNNIKKN